MSAGRPLTRQEMKANNSRTYLLAQRDDYIRRYGEDLGAYRFLLMLLQTHGSKLHKRGDTTTLRGMAHELNGIFAKYTQPRS
ncbi:carbohydrate ABC transporter [Streptomyces solincola]|uniref:Carbohydrate ABC transporter n=1 Tax=Streptomyces solincola TaxID=2100817 RepID=A0A2S9PZ03_9ACTN|nr:carbohydrate ABC transporter [Streptomyces solincola]PRH79659.1 carbohydrate ABC transporter [Streptomyces solincola]